MYLYFWDAFEKGNPILWQNYIWQIDLDLGSFWSIAVLISLENPGGKFQVFPELSSALWTR